MLSTGLHFASESTARLLLQREEEVERQRSPSGDRSSARVTCLRQRFRSGRNVCVAGKRKLKGGAAPLVRARP
jgi:hypothetical protein